MKRMTDSQDRLLDHDYDGIQELDNNLPRWWLYMFYISIVWGVLYFAYYHVLNIGYSSADEYRLEMNPSYVRNIQSDAKLFGLVEQYHSPYFNNQQDLTPLMILRGSGKNVMVIETRETDTVTYMALTNQAELDRGQSLYLTSCATCHGKLGEGGVGPNMTDAYWLHGNSMTDLVRSIKYGYPAQGMISWRGFLKPDQIIKVASFIETLDGTNPPNPKPPQGDLIE